LALCAFTSPSWNPTKGGLRSIRPRIRTILVAPVVSLAVAASSQAHPSGRVSQVHHRKGCKTYHCDRKIDRIWARKHRPRWVLPWPVVNCESKGTNEARHVYGPGIDPAGYYQIIGSTWSAYGGPPPADASKHPKRVQDRVARTILRRGGLSEWDCARKLGYA
jgi:hypothetical protein